MMLSVSRKKLCNETIKSSASTIGHNSDLLVNILYFLPVKSLCAFKIVSEQWLSVISDPYFERTYNLQSCRSSIPALFMKKRLINRRELEFETLVMDERTGIDFFPFTNPTSVKLEHSCNGLILFEVQDESTGCHTTYYVIYNPSMRHCKTLPSPPFRNACFPHVLGVTIAFDPAKSSHYQVVGVCSADISKDVFHIEIYSSKTDSWRDAGDPFPFSTPGILSFSGVYWNASVHWINQLTETLHYFDIDCESMKTISMPTKLYCEGDYSRRIAYFGECRGHMHLMEMLKDDIPRFDIWEMRTDYSGWNVKYYVDLNPLAIIHPGILQERAQFFHVLLIEEGKDSSRLILLISKNKVISFDLNNRSCKEMYDVNPDVRVEGFQYIETLTHA